MASKIGYIYYLQNPNTGEIFYVGATTNSLKTRLTVHYQHLKEHLRGERKSNRRYEYLKQILPDKATIHLLEVVTDLRELDYRERKFIESFRETHPNLTNMTDGGKGNHTSKYYTEEEMEAYSLKLSIANSGRKHTEEFKQNLSKARMGADNPGANKFKDPIVCFKGLVPVRMFMYAFEINEFTGSKHAYSNISKSMRNNGFIPYRHSWRRLSECDQETQDIVQTDYENSRV